MTDAFQVPEPSGRLSQLLSLYDRLKAEAEEAAERLKTVSDAIKSEVLQQYVDDLGEPYTRYSISSDGMEKPLTLVQVRSTRLRSHLVKTTYPEIYQECSTTSTNWTLKR